MAFAKQADNLRLSHQFSLKENTNILPGSCETGQSSPCFTGKTTAWQGEMMLGSSQNMAAFQMVSPEGIALSIFSCHNRMCIKRGWTAENR